MIMFGFEEVVTSHDVIDDGFSSVGLFGVGGGIRVFSVLPHHIGLGEIN